MISKKFNVKISYLVLSNLFLFSGYSLNSTELNCQNKQNFSQKDLNICAFKERNLTSQQLSLSLDDPLLRNWEKVTKEVCLEIWKTYREGSLFPLLASDCQTKLNKYLLDAKINGLKGK